MEIPTKSREIPSRYRYMAAALEALRDLGGEAKTGDVYSWLITHNLAAPSDLTVVQNDGGTRFRKEVRWARQGLVDAGYVISRQRGFWALTAPGLSAHLTPEVARLVTLTLAMIRRGSEVEETTSKENAPVLPSESPAAAISHRRVKPGPTRGVQPSSWSSVVTHSSTTESWTYLMRFGHRDLWKVGHSADLVTRLVDLNRHVPLEVLGEGWSLTAASVSSDSLRAYEMEQDVLARLGRYRTLGERLQCSEDTVMQAWRLAQSGAKTKASF